MSGRKADDGKMEDRERKKFMTIEELKKAYENGASIQFKLDGKGWWDWENPAFDCEPSEYRIKPRHRPFRDCGELMAHWRKMTGYPAKPNTMPLIWVRYKHNEHDVSFFIGSFSKTTNRIRTNDDWYDMKDAFDELCFLDGSPFGVKEEQC